MPTYGIEEEVFVTEPVRPTLRSLYYLSRVLYKDFRFYYVHSASNFARGKDLKQGLLGGVELSTGVHTSIEGVAADLQARRKDLASVCQGLIVPVGHLLDYDTPTNTCALQVHVGGVPDKERVCRNLLHFLPVLSLFTINSPMAAGERFGYSYRIGKGWAIGPIREDKTYRFQDIILSKRLGTVEIRLCDPCWDMNRIRVLLGAIDAIANLQEDLDPRVAFYNNIRGRVAAHGLVDELSGLVDELRALYDFPLDMIQSTAADQTCSLYTDGGLLAAYTAMDSGYRTGVAEPRECNLKQSLGLAQGLVGVFGYYVARLPYYAWKGLVEH